MSNKSKKITINNITAIDIGHKRLRIVKGNKPLFPKEIVGTPQKYNLKVIYGKKEYPTSYIIGSKDGKIRSGVLRLGHDLYLHKLNITLKTILEIELLDNGKYVIRKVSV